MRTAKLPQELTIEAEKILGFEEGLKRIFERLTKEYGDNHRESMKVWRKIKDYLKTQDEYKEIDLNKQKLAFDYVERCIIIQDIWEEK